MYRLLYITKPNSNFNFNLHWVEFSITFVLSDHPSIQPLTRTISWTPIPTTSSTPDFIYNFQLWIIVMMLITIMILMMITLIRMMMMVTYLLPNRALAGKLYFSRWPNGENNATQPSCSWKLGLGLSLAIFYNIGQ